MDRQLSIIFINKFNSKLLDWNRISSMEFKEEKFINEYPIRKYFKENIFREIVEKIFNPKNLENFVDLGYND